MKYLLIQGLFRTIPDRLKIMVKLGYKNAKLCLT